MTNNDIYNSTNKSSSYIVHPSLLNKIKSMIIYQDSMVSISNLDTKILIVLFKEEKEVCYFKIFTSHFYDSQKMDGYTLIDNYILVFYNIKNGCGHNLIDKSRLEKEYNKNFPDENSDAATHIIYEPWGRKYKIHSADSLELIRESYF